MPESTQADSVARNLRYRGTIGLNLTYQIKKEEKERKGMT